jgi:hypothetical protein
MIKKIFSALFLILLFLSSTPSSYAQFTFTDTDTNRTETAATIGDLEKVFASVVSALGILIGFAFFVMMIMGGIRYLLSGGDPKAVAAAKGTITWAILGLAVFALSYTILLVIRAFTGIDVTIFRIIGF